MTGSVRGWQTYCALAESGALPHSVLEYSMPICSPNAREAERLLALLAAYDREKVWLRTRRCHSLREQQCQVTFDVVDATGTALANRAGHR